MIYAAADPETDEFVTFLFLMNSIRNIKCVKLHHKPLILARIVYLYCSTNALATIFHSPSILMRVNAS